MQLRNRKAKQRKFLGSPAKCAFPHRTDVRSRQQSSLLKVSGQSVTFLMVFLIQNTQNRDAKAVHLKLDEMIRAVKGARNDLIDLESLSDEQLHKLEKQFERVRKKAERDGQSGLR
jgi:phosphomevalonate kinase